MPSFLVEAFTPIVASLPGIEQRARQAAAEVSSEGQGIRHVRSLFVPADEVCYHLFEAGSIDAVRMVTERAGLGPQRILAVIDGGAENAQSG
jgi:hypothetical protein